jgi:hypothetical protein
MLSFRQWSLVGIGIFCALVGRRPAESAQIDEPTYGGVPLTTLLEKAASLTIPRPPTPGKRDGGPAPDPKAADAVRDLPTNALPYLVQMLQEDGKSRMAINAFRLLGPKANPAAPSLEQLAQTSDKVSAVSGSIQALRYIGPGALPALQHLSTNSLCRVGAVAAIMEIGKGGAEIQPIFGELVQPGDTAAEMAVMGLRHYPATNALPLLTNVLAHPQPGMRKTAAEVIRQFDVQARPAVPALIERLYDSDKEVRDTVVFVLSRVAPEMFVTNSAPARTK